MFRDDQVCRTAYHQGRYLDFTQEGAAIIAENLFGIGQEHRQACALECFSVPGDHFGRESLGPKSLRIQQVG